jgi:protein-S-isoprenylcysteine O-methyltransferase Ste14
MIIIACNIKYATWIYRSRPLSIGGTGGLAGRIIGEERRLVNELEGYEDYKNKVKYRLLPYIW